VLSSNSAGIQIQKQILIKGETIMPGTITQVRGHVKDALGAGVDGATVKIKKSGVVVGTTTTFTSGEVPPVSGCFLALLIPGTYKAVASKTGYVTTTGAAFVVNGLDVQDIPAVVLPAV
jgi:hypothetical protein